VQATDELATPGGVDHPVAQHVAALPVVDAGLGAVEHVGEVCDGGAEVGLLSGGSEAALHDLNGSPSSTPATATTYWTPPLDWTGTPSAT
jgi:hypothetical protein